MSGYFEKGAWIGDSITPEEIEIEVKVRVDDSELAGLEERFDLLYSQNSLLRHQFKRLVELEQPVQRAGFKKRLWYLITGKL